MTSGQYRALVLIIAILLIEVLSNPAVKAVVGGWMSFVNKAPTGRLGQSGGTLA